MKPNELMIGNWVSDIERPGINCKIVSVSDDFPRYVYHGGKFRGGVSYDRIEGIPLTEEILLKAGFVEGENKWFVKEYSTGFTATEKHEIVYNVDSRRCGIQDAGDDSTTAFTVNTEHLHQLQNLYFSLTGEELKISL